MAIEKLPLIQTFWVSINTIFMDAFTICKMFDASQRADDVIVMAGVNHIVNMLHQFDPSRIQFVYNESGLLNLTHMVSGAPPVTTQSPAGLLHAFITDQAHK